MTDLGVDEKYRDYLIDSVNDEKCADFISLVDNLSSKAWWMCASLDSCEIKKRMEQHFEVRKTVIDKYKECLESVNL